MSASAVSTVPVERSRERVSAPSWARNPATTDTNEAPPQTDESALAAPRASPQPASIAASPPALDDERGAHRRGARGREARAERQVRMGRKRPREVERR